MKTPLILDMRGNSLDDGPGIRTVVFFKGCSLSCSWCHNPESKKTTAELSFDESECVGCDACIAVCEKKALSRKITGFVDRKKCLLCFLCTEVCPSGALSRVGREVSVKEIMATIARDMPFYRNSGGGVTLSGGEPTMFMDFASQILQECTKKKIHTLLETCGYFDWNEFEEKILPWIKMVYYDIKIMDPVLHKEYCGVSNKRILENFVKLASCAAERKIALQTRTPLVPGITDTSENLQAIAHYLSALRISSASLLPYNPMWKKKTMRLGINDEGSAPKTESWMENNHIDKCRSIFARYGILV